MWYDSHATPPANLLNGPILSHEEKPREKTRQCKVHTEKANLIISRLGTGSINKMPNTSVFEMVLTKTLFQGLVLILRRIDPVKPKISKLVYKVKLYDSPEVVNGKYESLQ